jgi:hypothetical protein
LGTLKFIVGKASIGIFDCKLNYNCTFLNCYKMQKKFEDMRKVREEHNYEVVKSKGKGAYVEVVLGKNST